jgi:hypothetical protein
MSNLKLPNMSFNILHWVAGQSRSTPLGFPWNLKASYIVWFIVGDRAWTSSSCICKLPHCMSFFWASKRRAQSCWGCSVFQGVWERGWEPQVPKHQETKNRPLSQASRTYRTINPKTGPGWPFFSCVKIRVFFWLDERFWVVRFFSHDGRRFLNFFSLTIVWVVTSPCLSLGLLSPPIPSFQWYVQSKEILLNLSMKCWNSPFTAEGSRVIIVVAEVGSVKIYVTWAEVLNKKERWDETQFIKIDGKTSLYHSYFILCKIFILS